MEKVFTIRYNIVVKKDFQAGSIYCMQLIDDRLINEVTTEQEVCYGV